MAGCIETMFYNGISTPSIGFGTWQVRTSFCTLNLHLINAIYNFINSNV